MKLLFDENLSSRLVGALADQFPNSSHVNLAGLTSATDLEIWVYADSARVYVSGFERSDRGCEPIARRLAALAVRLLLPWA